MKKQVDIEKVCKQVLNKKLLNSIVDIEKEKEIKNKLKSIDKKINRLQKNIDALLSAL